MTITETSCPQRAPPVCWDMVCVPIIWPFLVGRGLGGLRSSTSLSEPSSSRMSMSESSSFATEKYSDMLHWRDNAKCTVCYMIRTTQEKREIMGAKSKTAVQVLICIGNK